MPRRRGTRPARKGRSDGTAMVARTKDVHSRGETAGRVQPATRERNAAGGDSVLLRLSSIFQRPMKGTPRPKIQGRSCQSPRAHRCCRAAATGYWAGNSS
jgi:hypothetical protein